MKMKTAMGYHFTSIRMAIIRKKKEEKKRSVGKDVEIYRNPCALLVGM